MWTKRCLWYYETQKQPLSALCKILTPHTINKYIYIYQRQRINHKYFTVQHMQTNVLCEAGSRNGWVQYRVGVWMKLLLQERTEFNHSQSWTRNASTNPCQVNFASLGLHRPHTGPKATRRNAIDWLHANTDNNMGNKFYKHIITACIAATNKHHQWHDLRHFI